MFTRDSPRVKGSSPVRGKFFAEFIFLYYNSGRSDRMIYLRKNSIVSIKNILLNILRATSDTICPRFTINSHSRRSLYLYFYDSNNLKA